VTSPDSASFRRGSHAELQAWLDLALACCDDADQESLRRFRHDPEVSVKPDGTLVTEVDKAIERRIRQTIADRFPDHGMLGEEYGDDRPGASLRWFVDPIDGTHNFVRGIPLFGTLLALERDGEMQLGVMSAPALRQRWFASRGGGAWTTGAAGAAPDERRRLAVSSMTTLSTSQVLYGSPRDIESSGMAPGFGRLLDQVWRDRGFGDFWGYALVADGAAEAMIEVGVSAWDLAAPLVVVEEAGGRLTDVHGERTITGRSVLASNGHLHEAIIRELATNPEELETGSPEPPESY
jgi:histidinol-phosphatase